MKPISEVFHGDCMAFMAGLPDGYFELSVVDPPYGVGMNGGKSIGLRKKWSRSYAAQKHHLKDWDNAPDGIFFDELFRISKNWIIWGANYFNLPSSRGIMAWDKMCDTSDFSDFELAYSSFDRGAKICRIPIQKESQRRIHPTQKPVALYVKVLCAVWD